MRMTKSLGDGSRFTPIHTALAVLVLALGLAGTPGTGLAQVSGLRASAEKLTSDLVNLHAQSRQASLSTPPAGQLTQAEVMSNLLRVAQRRHQLLAELIDEDPGAVLAVGLPAALRAGLPLGVQVYVEEDVQTEGVLEVLHADSETGGRYLYFLVDDHGKRFSLHFAARPPQRALTGDRVRAKGLRIDRAIALGSGETAFTTTSTAPVPNTFGPQKTILILVTFQDQPTPPYTVSYAQGVMRTTSSFYLENSHQQTSLTGVVNAAAAADVAGWYPIAMNSTVCDYLLLAYSARVAAQAAGIDLSPYKRFVYGFPSNACGWWGLGTVGGYPSQAWINGSFQLRVVGHEMGHNLGLYHSHALECGNVTIAPNCTKIEYGDTLDIMGTSSGHFNAFQKELLGWLNYGQSPPITTIASSGIYTLDPYESGGSNPKALKVPTAPGNWYYVEYRQPIGFDAFMSGDANVVNGIVLHFGSESSRDSSYLLDLTPSTSSWLDPALGVGQTFSDPLSGATITPVWADGTNAGISVAIGPAACARANPTIAVSPTLNRSPAGAEVSYTASVTNNDGPGCATSSFTQRATVPTGWTPTFTVPALTLGPGATASTILRVTSPASAADGAYPITAISTNDVSPAFAASTSATYVVTTGGAGGSFMDTFDRADSTALGNGWVAIGGNLMIQGNQLRNAEALGSHRAVLPALTAATQTVAATFASTDNNGGPRLGLILRYRDPQNYYLVYRQAGGGSVLRIAKVVNGVETVLASVGVPNPTRDVFFRLTGSANGGTLTVSLEGVKSISVSDSTFTGGSIGILMGSTTRFPKLVKSYRADNFSATVAP